MLTYYDIIECNLRELFKFGKVSVVDKELGDFFCRMDDGFGFSLIINLMIVEQSCFITLCHETSTREIFDIQIRHYINSITRDKDSLKIWRYDNLPAIEFSFKPNFSLKLPVITFYDKAQDIPLVGNVSFNSEDLYQLFGSVPTMEELGSLTYNITNNNGFTLLMNLSPSTHKLHFMLTYEKYLAPVFDITFADIQKLECDLTSGTRQLKIQSRDHKEQAKILFDSNFALDR